jgi:hypothetical protein
MHTMQEQTTIYREGQSWAKINLESTLQHQERMPGTVVTAGY